MLNWKRDIRRNLPEYRTREGDVVYNAPYRATKADLNAFALYADPTALERLLNDELNECVNGPALVGSQRGLHFSPAEPFIVLIYSAFRSFSSTDETDRRLGRAQAFELSIWVPIVKEQLVSGIVTSEPAWFLPLVYTSPTASVATGREVYGYPKIPAYLEIPDEGGAPIAVQLREEFEDPGVAQKKKRVRLFTAPRQQTPARPGWNIDLNRNPQLAAIINRYLANHPIVFRKQVGMLENAEVGGVVAGYTALIESRVPITRISSLNPLDATEALRSNVGGLDQELAARLGLKDLVPQLGISLHDCRLDIQHGREIWVASERRKFIKPLPAPGSSLIWTPRPFTAQGRALTRASLQAAPEAPDTGDDSIEGVAEAYFGRTRRFAIQSLLERHFPDHLSWRPTADPDRDFVMFLFLRANEGAEVHLYELSVWVPVLHQGVAAWYSPYVFRSPGAAVIQARQRFGHPCQEGFIEFKDDSSTRTVFVRLPTSLGHRGVDWLRRDGIKFEACPDAADTAAFSESVAFEALTLNVEQNVVGLLQFRHAADTTRACLQEIVCSRRMMKASAPRPIGEWKATLPGELRFGRLLDLDGDSQMVRGYRFDEITIETSPWTVYGNK
jgi:hypothetical protein